MAAYQLKTFIDIVNAVLEITKIQASDTAQINRIKRDINIVYLNLVCPLKNWTWLKKRKDITINPYISTGTASVTEGSNTVTLSSAPTSHVVDSLFMTDAYSEMYKIQSISGTTLTLDSKYTGDTASGLGYKIVQDKIPLPAEFNNVAKVWHDHSNAFSSLLSSDELVELILNNPRLSGRPTHFSVGESIEQASEYASISGLPALSTRASSGLVKTLVFASSVESYLEVGDKLEITSAGDDAYNEEVVVGSVATTTITFITTKALDETATADATLTVKIKGNNTSELSYRYLYYYPFISNDYCNLHVEGIIKPKALEANSDEPLMALEDRIVLYYGTLARAWARQRNEVEANKSEGLFANKLAKMAGSNRERANTLKIKPSEFYLTAKRKSGINQQSSRWSDF